MEKRINCKMLYPLSLSSEKRMTFFAQVPCPLFISLFEAASADLAASNFAASAARAIDTTTMSRPSKKTVEVARPNMAKVQYTNSSLDCGFKPSHIEISNF